MNYSLGNMLSRGGALNPDKLSLDLAFAADKTLTARKGPTPTFTRASTGTFVGSNGLIQSAAINVPRFDHDPVTGICRGLLIEEQRMNTCTNSNLLTAASWNQLNLSVASSGTSPDGSSAFEITEAAINAGHSLFNSGGATSTANTTIVSGTTYTQSVFFKKSGSSIDWVQLTFTSGGFGFTQYANFDIGNGVVGNSSGVTPRIESFPNGWYRCSITATATGPTTGVGVIINLINNVNTAARGPSYLGSTANKILASLGQFEAGSFPTSYIPTTTTALTRSADVCSIANTSSFWNSAEFTLFTNANWVASGFDSYSSNFNITAGFFGARRTSTNQAVAIIRSSGVNADINFGSFTTGSMRMAIAHITGQQAASLNGASAVQYNSVFVPSSNPPFNIGGSGSGAYINGHIARIQYFRKRLPNAKLQSLTAP